MLFLLEQWKWKTNTSLSDYRAVELSDCRTNGLSDYSYAPDINITNHGITKLLSNFDPSKAADPDEQKPTILKELASSHRYYASSSINLYKLELSLLIGALHMFHPFTRRSVSILLKTIDLHCILLACIWCNILEHVVVNAIMIHADNYNILYSRQHGFRTKQIMWNITFRIHWWCHNKYGKFTSNRCFNYWLF